MAITATELQEYLDALRRARYQGVRVVQKGDESVRYGSDAEMAAAEAAITAEIASANSTTPESYSTLTSFKRMT